MRDGSAARQGRSGIKAWLALALTMLPVVVPAAAAQQRTYTNPILDEEFPDPSTVKVGNAMYAYGTGEMAANAATPYIRMTASTDLVHWSPAVTVMQKPRWASGATWAPHVIADPNAAGRLVMYFSAKSIPGAPGVPADADKCLGVAVATSPAGPFVPQPEPLRCGPRFFNIDPMAFPLPNGRFMLFWGSAHQPIVRQPLARDLLGFEPGSKPTEVIAPVKGGKYTSLIEGSWVLDHGGYRYLFTSGSDCCRAADAYAVTVARRKLPDGKWERFAGSADGAILRHNAAWEAPGHNGIFLDGKGQYWIIYHARHAGEAKKRVLLMDRIDWVDGWPRVANDSPSSTPMPAPAP